MINAILTTVLGVVSMIFRTVLFVVEGIMKLISRLLLRLVMLILKLPLKLVLLANRLLFHGVTTSLSLTNNFTKSLVSNPLLMTVYFVANVPIWLIWVIFVEELIYSYLEMTAAITMTQSLAVLSTALVLLSRAYVIYLVHHTAVDDGLPKKLLWPNPIRLVNYLLLYISEQAMSIGLYMLLILPIAIMQGTDSILVFGVFVAVIFSIWYWKRFSKVNAFYKGVFVELFLVILWLGLYFSSSMIYQACLFLMIVMTVSIFFSLRVQYMKARI